MSEASRRAKVIAAILKKRFPNLTTDETFDLVFAIQDAIACRCGEFSSPRDKGGPQNISDPICPVHLGMGDL